MRKLATPKRVTLCNGRTFLARYKRVLPVNITMERRYRGRVAAGRRRRPPRKGQRGKGFFNTLKKIAKHPLVKKLGKKALTYAPKLYNYGTSKIKNKAANKVSHSAAAKDILNRGASYGKNG